MNDQPPSADQIASAIIAKLFRGIAGIFLIIWVIYFLGVARESMSRSHKEAEESTIKRAETQRADDEAAIRSIRASAPDSKKQ